jgi:hypothetical protein
MLLTQQGMLAIDSPNGWVRADGPGLAYFVPKAGTTAANNVFIYISSAPIGPTEDTKNLKEYVESDIAGFKHRFKSGVITEETPIDLPFAKSKAPAYTFCSAEVNNAFEKIVYIAEKNRVLILALSAKKKDAFDESQSVFRQFVQSYRGSLAETAPGR